MRSLIIIKSVVDGVWVVSCYWYWYWSLVLDLGCTLELRISNETAGGNRSGTIDRLLLGRFEIFIKINETTTKKNN